MNEILNLQKSHKLLDIFCELVKIPSASMHEEAVADKILEMLNYAGIEAKKDSYGNVIGKISASDSSKKPILLSAHMDVVGSETPVNIRLSKDKKFIETDKKTTLGADDKAGVAAAILLAQEVIKDKNIKHGGLELVFTRDEEQNMSGIKNLNTKELSSQYVLVLDASQLGEILVSGAGYTKAILSVTAKYGGHSGVDINDEKRVNALKLVAELVNAIPQGVYKKNESGVITSINAGAIIGGGVNNPIKALIDGAACDKDSINYIIGNSVTNVINTNVAVSYSIRSSEPESEQALIRKLKNLTEEFNQKYKGLACAKIEFAIHLKPFEKSNDDYIEKIAAAAAQKNNIKPLVGSFHAGAETHIYNYEINKNSNRFKPCLIGVANIYNMHSVDECIEIDSFLKGYGFLKTIFLLHNE